MSFMNPTSSAPSSPRPLPHPFPLLEVHAKAFQKVGAAQAKVGCLQLVGGMERLRGQVHLQHASLRRQGVTLSID